MRAIFGLGLAAAALALTAGCSKKESNVSVPPDGTYIIVGAEQNGKAAPPETFDAKSEADRTIRIAGDKMLPKEGSDDPLTVKWDSSKNPGQITATATKPGGKTETMYGIYKFEGDTLTICMTEGKEEDRPKEFKTAPGSKTMMMTLKKK